MNKNLSNYFHKLSQNRELQVDPFRILIDETFNLFILLSII